jgi:hypothetical protein
MATSPRFTSLALAASVLAWLLAPYRTPAEELTPPPIKPLYVPLFDGLDQPPPAPAPEPEADRGVRQLRQQVGGPGWSVSSSTVLRDPKAGPEVPSPQEPWRTEQALRVQLYGPLFAFGQVGAGSKQAAAEELKVSGRTGVGCKLPSLFGAEMQLRGGSLMTCTDPQRPERLKEHSELLFEVQYRQPLFGRIGLEYQGTAVPAFDPTARDRIDQDLGLAMPVGGAGKLRLGAKHRWENLPTPKPGADGMQLYLGLELGR